MAISKDDFQFWKQSEVTKAVMSGFRERIRELEIQLGGSAGVDPLQDRYVVGAISAYTDILNIDVEETLND